jgi:hypothetical protein
MFAKEKAVIRIINKVNLNLLMVLRDYDFCSFIWKSRFI